MASEGLDFNWRLNDKGSAPAAKIGVALDTLSGKVGKAGQTVNGFDKSLGAAVDPVKTGRIQGFADKMGKMFGVTTRGTRGAVVGMGAFGKSLDGIDDQLATFGTSLGGIAAFGAKAGAAVVAVAVGLAVAGAKMSIDAAGFREDATIGLEAVLGSKIAADAAYEKILDAADRVGLDKGEAISRFTQLINKGLNESTAMRSLEAMANIQALGEAGGKQGKKFMKDLQSAIEKGGPEVEKVLREIEGSKIAGLGEKKGAGIGRLAGDVVGNFSRLFDKVDISPLKNVLKSTIDALQGPSGVKLRASFERLFGAIFKGFERIFGGSSPESVIDGLATAIGGAATAAEKFGSWVERISVGLDKWGKISDKLDKFSINGKQFSADALLIESSLSMIALSFQVLGEAIAFTVDPVGTVTGWVRGIDDALGSTVSGWIDAGRSAASRFAAGIWAGIGDAINAASALGGAAVQALLSSIGLGGTVGGSVSLAGPSPAPANDVGGLVTSVSGGMATVTAAPGEGLASVGTGERIVPAGAASGAAMPPIEININITGASAADASTMREAVRAGVADALEQMGVAA